MRNANSRHCPPTLSRNDYSMHCNDQIIIQSTGLTNGCSSNVYMILGIDQLKCSTTGSATPILGTCVVCNVAGHRGW